MLKHVAYGTVSPYEKVTSGEYTVAMRAAGAKPGSPPVLSTTVNIARAPPTRSPGWARPRRCGCRCCDDRLTTPKGESLVRVIQASLRDHKVTVTAGSQVLAHQLAFGNVTSYADRAAGHLDGARRRGGRNGHRARSRSPRAPSTRSSCSTAAAAAS